ncbi:MAG: hypothetical protein WC450_06255, partial [Candidatus Omnitrophota bacterium]
AGFPQAGLAQSNKVDPQTKQLCNQVMINIYKEILSLKDKYRELSQFDKGVLYKNKVGIYAIVYKYKEKMEYPDGTVEYKIPYSFAVTIDRMKDKTFEERDGAFAYSFPALSLKFNGYQNKRLLRTQFSILDVLGAQGKVLNDYQQQFLSVRLFIKSSKDVYKVDEPVDFEVYLTNVSKANLVMKELNDETLHFSINGKIWGAGLGDKKAIPKDPKEANKMALEARREARNVDLREKRIKQGLLAAGEAFTITFQGITFSEPQDVVVEAVYNVPIKEVYPTAFFQFKVVE